MSLELLGNTLLRTAITQNLVTFPAQIRPFFKRSAGDVQERIVQLYFVRGWTVRSICDRYNLSKAMVHKLLADWRIRAVESGYIQEVEPGNLAALVPEAQHSGGAAYKSEAISVPARTVQITRVPEPRPEFAYTRPETAHIPLPENGAALFAGRSA